MDLIGTNGTTAPAEIKIVVGLGNPGSAYARHRHNVGFQCVDLLAAAHGLRFDKAKNKALLSVGQNDGQRVILLKPMTFMNAVGPAVVATAHFYKVMPTDMLVIFDDLDLPQGRLRLRPEGGSGGHNGMKSIIQQLGTPAFPRLRIGIGRPPGRMDPADYVLQEFSAAEEEMMEPARQRASEATLYWLRTGIADAMNAFNVSPGPVGEP